MQTEEIFCSIFFVWIQKFMFNCDSNVEVFGCILKKVLLGLCG
jgi:hypothetical protein